MQVPPNKIRIQNNDIDSIGLNLTKLKYPNPKPKKKLNTVQ